MKISQNDYDKLNILHARAIEATDRASKSMITLEELATYLKGLIAERSQIIEDQFIFDNFNAIDRDLRDYQMGSEIILNTESGACVASHLSLDDDLEVA